MSTRVDGRPLRIDVYANPELDGPGIALSGFPSTYLDGATITAPVYALGTETAAGAAWTVTTGATTVTLSMPQANVALIGSGRYSWALIIALASGAKPATVGGTLFVALDNKPSVSSTSATFASDPIGVDITIEQVLSETVSVIDGGTAAGTGSEIIDGGNA